MKYLNLNPELTTELVEKCGFNFDGYYYVSEKCGARLLKNDDGGFDVSFVDPAAPQIDLKVKNYAELVTFMARAVSQYIETEYDKVKATMTDPQETQRFIANKVKEFYSFDQHISMALQFSARGLAIIPNNEYTFSITNNAFNKFKVYCIEHPENEENGEIRKVEFEVEIAPQCISWPFLVEAAKDYTDEGYKLSIESVKFLQDDKEIPFFGLGIQKLHKK